MKKIQIWSIHYLKKPILAEADPKQMHSSNPAPTKKSPYRIENGITSHRRKYFSRRSTVSSVCYKKEVVDRLGKP